MSTIEQCKRQRANIERNIIRIKTLVTTSAGKDTGLSSDELRCRLGILESYFTQAMAVQSEIETLAPNDSGCGELETKVAIKDQLGEGSDHHIHRFRWPNPVQLLCRRRSCPVLPCQRSTENLQSTKISSTRSHKLSLMR